MKLPARTIMSVSLLALVAAVAIGVIVVTRDDADAAPAAAPAVTKQVAVERGDITVSESVDGTVEETDTITRRPPHRGTGLIHTEQPDRCDIDDRRPNRTERRPRDRRRVRRSCRPDVARRHHDEPPPPQQSVLTPRSSRPRT